MAYCTHCGTNIPEGSAYCPGCGAPAANNAGQYGYQQNNYQQNNYQQPFNRSSAGEYKVNIQKRNIGLCILLTIVTCGIYGIIWFFNIVNDLNIAAKTPDDKTPGTIILLTIVTCGIYGWIWLYNAGEKVDKIRQFKGEAPSNSGTLYLLLAIFGLGILDYYFIQDELNKVALLEA